jgi:hypothetical protein
MMWEVALVTHPVIRVRPNDIEERFTPDFVIDRNEVKNFVTKRGPIRFNFKGQMVLAAPPLTPCLGSGVQAHRNERAGGSKTQPPIHRIADQPRMWRHLLFDTLYRLGRPVWDTPPPEKLRDAIEGPDALPPGHALDLGCGTGTNVMYLAQHGWQATGIDFSAAAIGKARQQAKGIAGATFIEGDVTKLSHLDISRPINPVIDMGNYHSLPDDAKPTYVAELAITEPGTPLMMWQGIRVGSILIFGGYPYG